LDPMPNGETIPTPVMTTLLMMIAQRAPPADPLQRRTLHPVSIEGK
jgi:hypothetical protein